MFSRANKFSALAVILFLAAAAFYVESGHAARRRFISRVLRAAGASHSEKGRAPSDERKTLKRGMDIDDESALSDTDQTSSRNLSPKEKRFEVVFGDFHLVSFPRLILAPKVPTNLFLSVWNL
jgi:hypothetical protein